MVSGLSSTQRLSKEHIDALVSLLTILFSAKRPGWSAAVPHLCRLRCCLSMCGSFSTGVSFGCSSWDVVRIQKVLFSVLIIPISLTSIPFPANSYYLVFSPVLRWLLIFVQRPEYDGGGKRWPLLHEILISSMIVAQVGLNVLFLQDVLFVCLFVCFE